MRLHVKNKWCRIGLYLRFGVFHDILFHIESIGFDSNIMVFINGS